MCDFREIQQIILLSTDQTIDIDECKSVWHSDMDKVTDPGLYHIGCTGCYHLYYDGEQFLKEHYEYDLPNGTKYIRSGDYVVTQFREKDIQEIFPGAEIRIIKL